MASDHACYSCDEYAAALKIVGRSGQRLRGGEDGQRQDEEGRGEHRRHFGRARTEQLICIFPSWLQLLGSPLPIRFTCSTGTELIYCEFDDLPTASITKI